MRTINVLLIFLILASFVAQSQEMNSPVKQYWQIGVGLGELPMGGSFKPSITFGYHVNEKLYAGIVYQFKDKISRNSSSFNAKSAELSGLQTSSETVSQRFLVQVRYQPLKCGPYLSGGFVFNGEDSEDMIFDDRIREIAGEEFLGDIHIQQTRPGGWGLALGLGYQYDFKNGISAGFEWTPAWGQYPAPNYMIGGSADLSAVATDELQNKMDTGFRNSVTNMYKVFHIGVAYRFQ